MPKLRCLNEDGIRALEGELDLLASDADHPVPTHLLTDPRYSDAFPLGVVEIEPKRFRNKGDFATYLDSRFVAAGINHDVDLDGMWEWLSLYYIETTCPIRRDGTRKVGRLYRHLINPASGRQPRRHLLRGAYMLHRRLADEDRTLLEPLMCYTVDNYPLIWTHLNERSAAFNSRGVLAATRELFFDHSNSLPKTGIGQGVYDVRAFGKAIMSIPSQFDVETLSATTVLALLDQGFDDWIDDQDRRDEIRSLRSDLRRGRFLDEAAAADDEMEIAIAMNDALESLSAKPRTKLDAAQRLSRNDLFRPAVLTAYQSSCSVSGLGLVHESHRGDERYEVEAAHIVPVARGGIDSVANGLALNRTIHWAFDNGMLWIDGEYRVNIAQRAADNDRNDWLLRFNGRRMSLPCREELRPKAEFLRWHADQVAEAATV